MSNPTSVQIMIGPTIPLPLPGSVLEMLRTIEVNTTDDGRSDFEVTFEIMKDCSNFKNFSFLTDKIMDMFNRLVVLIESDSGRKVIIDGIITDHKLKPSKEPGSSTLTLKGEDISVMLDMEEVIKSHPAQNDFIIAGKIILSYAKYGLIPTVIPPKSIDTPNPLERIPVQHGTDLQYLGTLAQRHGYVFYIKPGPAPGVNIAYWGPPVRAGVPQKALSVDMGAETNVTNIDFDNNGMAPTQYEANFQDFMMGKAKSIISKLPTRKSLSNPASLMSNLKKGKKRIMKLIGGINMNQAMEWAQGQLDKAIDDSVTAKGELDTIEYGNVLVARDIVAVRGAGESYNGIYYVKSVTHKINTASCSFTQEFELARSGIGSLISRVAG